MEDCHLSLVLNCLVLQRDLGFWDNEFCGYWLVSYIGINEQTQNGILNHGYVNIQLLVGINKPVK